MKDERKARDIAPQFRLRIGGDFAWALAGGSFLLLMALLFGSAC